MSGDITQNMILLFMMIPTEHFHSSLSESFDDKKEKSCNASTSRCPIQNFPEALYETTGGTCSARFFRPVIGVTPHQNIPWFKLSFLALDGFVFSRWPRILPSVLVKAHRLKLNNNNPR